MADNGVEEVKAEILEPGKNIKPIMTSEQAVEMVERLYGLKVTDVKEMASYDDKNYRVKVSSEYSNSFIPELWADGYTLKVLNSMDSKKNHVEAEHEAQAILQKAGINCPQPVRNIEGKFTTLEKIIYKTEDKTWLENNKDSDTGAPPHGHHLVRLLTFLKGKIFFEVPYTSSLLYQSGQHIARIEKALLDWRHPEVASYPASWRLTLLPTLMDYLHVVEGAGRRSLVTEIVHTFSTQVLPREALFSTGHLHHDFNDHNIIVAPRKHTHNGVIHGDYNEQNLIVRQGERTADSSHVGERTAESAHVGERTAESAHVGERTAESAHVGERTAESSHEEYEIVGVIDFSDMAETCYVYEVGITIMYMMVESKRVDPLDVGGHVLAGYLTTMDLNEAEFDALKFCVAGRFAQSLVMGAYSYSQDPSNDYVLVTSARGWGILKNFWETPKDELYARWRQVMDSYKS